MSEPPDDDAVWAPKRQQPDASTQSLLPGYHDFVLVARGGDSLVYRAHQDTLDRDVAIKIVQLADPDSIARFRRELALTVQLGRAHPNIMTVLATGTTTDGQPCLVMDFCELGSLHTRLTERGPLPVNEVVAAGTVVADALAFAHGQGVLHRDVKPQNVLVLPTSYVLADFGLARAIDAGHSASLERFSYRHASPQILDGEAPTTSDDIYSLGSTLFTLLDGRPPFAADDPDEDSALSYLRRARTEPTRDITRSDVPDSLVRIVMRCLSRDRTQRYGTAAELMQALDDVPTETRSWAPEPVARTPAEPVSPPESAGGVSVAAEPDAAAAEESHPAITAEPESLVAKEPDLPVALEPGPPTVDPVVAAPPSVSPSTDVLPTLPSVSDRPSESALGRIPVVSRSGPGVDATGLRPVEPTSSASAPPTTVPTRRGNSRRWIILAAVVVVALAAGVLAGVLDARHDTTTAGQQASGSPRTSPSSLVRPVPTISVSISSAAATPVVDPALMPRITTLRRSAGGLRLSWTDPSKGRFPFVVFLTDNGTRSALASPQRGVTATTLASFPSGRHCLRVSTISSNSADQIVLGIGPQRCTSD